MARRRTDYKPAFVPGTADNSAVPGFFYDFFTDPYRIMSSYPIILICYDDSSYFGEGCRKHAGL